MSFFLECLFYYINQILNIALVQGIINTNLAYYQKIIVGTLVVAMVCVSVFALIKTTKNRNLYLDIPFIYIATFIDFFVLICMPEIPIKFIWSVPLKLAADIFLAIRFFKWVNNIVKKHKKPEKKNILAFICYIFLLILTVVLLVVNSFDLKKDEVTFQEIDNVNKCYDYTQEYLISLPDSVMLENIYEVTQATVDGAFDNAYFVSQYSDGVIVDTINQVAGISSAEKKRDYCDIIAMHLKTLLALGKTEEYQAFFIENCSYLVFPDWSYYFDLWVQEKNYTLTADDFDVIIDAYDEALGLCDNDVDRLIILDSIIDFYTEFASNDEKVNEYKQLKSDIYDRNDYQLLLDESKYRSEYLSENLKIDV